MMKNTKRQTHFLSLLFILLIVSCSAGNKKATNESGSDQVTKQAEQVEINTEAKLLLEYLNEQGDYVNSREFPSMIKASSVHDELDGNIKIIDIRDDETFAEGHIKNAENVEFSNLPEYFSNEITPSDYDKIIMICYSGQTSSYATLLLRLMGYNNVYSMKWGMSGWNKDFAEDFWFYNISSDYEDQLEVSVNEKASPGDLPKLNTGKNSGKEIFDERIKSMFEEGTESIYIRVDSIINAPQSYYTINYDRRDKYEDGHLPGAIRYKPNGTLGIVDEMQTLPTEKEIVTYCQTGQNSGFVTAYLRLFGYDAKSLLYGNNAFMHDKMVKNKVELAWSPFTDEEIESYDYVK